MKPQPFVCSPSDLHKLHSLAQMHGITFGQIIAIIEQLLPILKGLPTILQPPAPPVVPPAPPA